MRLKIFPRGFTLLVALFAVSLSQGKDIREELVRKSVSVSLPKRKSSVISHFTPAGHEYEAQANVLIERIKKAPKKIKKERPVKKKLATDVQVKSPAVKFSQSKHFDPAYHIYSAAGKLLLDEKSPLLDVNGNVRKTFQRERFSLLNDLSAPIGKPSSIVFKSPERKLASSSSIVNHFNPARHIYQSSDNSDFRTLTTNSDVFEVDGILQLLGSPNPKSFNRRKRSLPSNLVHASSSDKSAAFSLEKSVSLKSPERKNTVINHFSPASHIYSATGNVKINRQQSKTNPISDSVSFSSNPTNTISRKQFQQAQIFNQKSKSDAKRNDVQLQTDHQTRRKFTNKFTSHGRDESFQAGNAIFVKSNKPSKHQDGFVIEKKVSIATPQRKSNVINHFSPDIHKFNAESSVVINRNPSTFKKFLQNTATKTVEKPINIEEQQPIKIAVKNTERVSPTVLAVKSSKPNSGSRNTFSNSDLSIKKTISIKTPDTKSSVISHFAPANHRFEATGNVVINRGSILSTKNAPQNKLSVNKRIEKPQVIESVFIENENEGEIQDNTKSSKSNVVRRVNTFANTGKSTSSMNAKKVFGASTNMDRKFALQQASSSSQSENRNVDQVVSTSDGIGKSGVSRIFLEKSVSVKSPNHESSVISHFRPATHNYAAVGNVLIDRIVSADAGKSLNSLPSKETKQIVFKPVSKVEKSIATDEDDSEKTGSPINQDMENKVMQDFQLPDFDESNLNFQREKPDKEEEEDEDDDSDEDEEESSSVDGKSKAVFDFGPAASYDLPSLFSSYLPPDETPVKQEPVVRFTPQVRRPEPNRAQRVDPPRRQPPVIELPRRQPPRRQPPVVELPKRDPPQRPISRNNRIGGLELDKLVSVTSPPDRSSVINHFKPAIHTYKATGEVNIARGEVN